MKVRDGVPVVSPPPAPWDIDCQAAADGLTKQEFLKDCDVNEILKRCLRFGVPLPDESVRATFADVSQLGDFSACMHRIKAAEDAFMTLDAAVRSRFSNDPGQLLSFLQDPANVAEAIKLGLVDAPKASVPPPAAVVVPVAPVVPPVTASA